MRQGSFRPDRRSGRYAPACREWNERTGGVSPERDQVLRTVATIISHFIIDESSSVVDDKTNVKNRVQHITRRIGVRNRVVASVCVQVKVLRVGRRTERVVQKGGVRRYETPD